MKLILHVTLWIAAAVQLANAADRPEPAVNASDKASFDTVSEWVRKQMNDGGRYAHTDARERATVSAQLDTIEKMFAAHPTVAQMSDEERLRLYNSQQEINGILSKRDGERLICRTERPVGSNIPVKTCHTAASIEARRSNDTIDMKKRQDVFIQRATGN